MMFLRLECELNVETDVTCSRHAEHINALPEKSCWNGLPTWIIGMPWIANDPNVQIVMKMD